MDCTLFDYKFSNLNDHQQPQQRSASHSNILFYRPVSSHQSHKIMQSPTSVTLQDHRSPRLIPQTPASTRSRPITALSRQSRVQSNNVTRNGASTLVEELTQEEEARLIEKTTTFVEPAPLQQIQKIMPRHIQADKESLYIDTLHMKQYVNTIKEENNRLKTRNLTLERDNIKLVKAVEKVGTDPITYGKQPVEGALLISLKKQVKELKEELQMRIEELDEMRRNTKFTKFQEIEVELKAYADENIRLRGILNEVMKNRPQIKAEDYNDLEERFYMQNNQIENFKRDHARLTSEMKYLEDQNHSLQVARETEVRNNQRLIYEAAKLKKQMREKDQKIMPWLKLEATSAARGTPSKAEEKPKVEEDNTEWKRLVEQREQVIMQREKALEELRLKYNDKLNNEHRERQNHNMEVNKWKEQYTDLESRYRALINMHYSHDEKRKFGESKSGSKYDDELSESKIDKSFGFEIKNKKVKRLVFDDVSSLGYELSLKLRARRVFLEDIMKLLDKYGPKLSMTDVKNVLMHDPFGIKDENNALLLARYLVEPNEEEFLLFDLNREQEMVIIKSVFRKLVGSYTPLEEEDERIMNDEVGEIIHKYEQSLRTQFAVIPESKSGYLSSEHIAKTFNLLAIHLSPKNFEYLLMNLYEYTNSLKKLDYLKMFEIFETEEHKRLKKIIEMYQNQNDGGFESERSDRRATFVGNDGVEQNSKSHGEGEILANKDVEEEKLKDEGMSFGQESEEEEDDGEEEEEEEEDQPQFRR